MEYTPTEKNLQALGTAYREYQMAKRGAPASLDHLKIWVNSQSAEMKKKMGIDDVDKSFKSPRDNQPFVLVNAPPSRGGGPVMMPVIAYEKTGEGGKQWAIGATGSTEELSSSELQSRLQAAARMNRR